MAAYKLYHMDYPVMSFRIDRRDVLDAKIDKQNSEHLPIALKRILRYAAEFIAEETPDQYVLSDEGNVMVDDWLSNRQIPADRDAYQKYVKNPSHVRAWMLENDTLPEGVHGTTINGLYGTEDELLSHVKNLRAIDINKLPSDEEYRAILEQCSSLKEYRIDKLVKLYQDKINYLHELQLKTE